LIGRRIPHKFRRVNPLHRSKRGYSTLPVRRAERNDSGQGVEI
jgi:hypothetical protein